jgi:hypothetical protein
MSAENARRMYEDGRGNRGFRRKPMRHSARTVSVSARWLLEVLAGEISLEDALKTYNRDVRASRGAHLNPFRALLESGRLPVTASVIHDPDADDDEIVLEFGDPDPAVAKFDAR